VVTENIRVVLLYSPLFFTVCEICRKVYPNETTNKVWLVVFGLIRGINIMSVLFIIFSNFTLLTLPQYTLVNTDTGINTGHGRIRIWITDQEKIFPQPDC
jgi:hypothetical protein